MMNATSPVTECHTDYTAKASEALLDILKVAVYNQLENEGSRACLGKQLCKSTILSRLINQTIQSFLNIPYLIEQLHR